MCSRRLQQTTFSDAFFLGALRVNVINKNHKRLTASLTNAADTDMAINKAKIEKR